MQCRTCGDTFDAREHSSTSTSIRTTDLRMEDHNPCSDQSRVRSRSFGVRVDPAWRREFVVACGQRDAQRVWTFSRRSCFTPWSSAGDANAFDIVLDATGLAASQGSTFILISAHTTTGSIQSSSDEWTFRNELT